MNIIDPHALLTPAQLQLLRDYAQKPFTLGKYRSLDEILTELNVEVHIEPGIIKRETPPVLDQIEKYWKEEADRLEKLICDEKSKQAFLDARKKMEEAMGEKRHWNKMPLRGLYDPETNCIKLYPEEMANEYDGVRMDELLVSTLAHETMHAYFNRPLKRKKYPYVLFVEEPLAEFGMLLYLKDIGSNFYKWAYNDVSKKQTCYRYGAKLMDQFLKEATPSPTRKFLEEYKILLDEYALFTISNGCNIVFPIKDPMSTPVVIDGQTIYVKWNDLFEIPPKYFYDASTKTLGLDGSWTISGRQQRHFYFLHFDFYFDFDNIYLGANFTIDDQQGHDVYNVIYLFERCNIIVSPSNKQFDSINGIPVLRQNGVPVLLECGKGLYRICRNGKWGVIDKDLQEVITCKYDYMWRNFDDNSLLKVGKYNNHSTQYGLVDMAGEEIVPPIYDDISINEDGTYTVKQGDKEIIIDKNGNRIDKE